MTAARARAEATRRQQKRQERGQWSNDSCKDDSEGDVAREGKAVTTTGYPGKGDDKVGSNGGGKSNRQHGDNSGVPR